MFGYGQTAAKHTIHLNSSKFSHCHRLEETLKDCSLNDGKVTETINYITFIGAVQTNKLLFSLVGTNGCIIVYADSIVFFLFVCLYNIKLKWWSKLYIKSIGVMFNYLFDYIPCLCSVLLIYLFIYLFINLQSVKFV